MAGGDAVDLVQFFREVADGLPTSVDDEHVFTARNVPEPPPMLQTGELVYAFALYSALGGGGLMPLPSRPRLCTSQSETSRT